MIHEIGSSVSSEASRYFRTGIAHHWVQRSAVQNQHRNLIQNCSNAGTARTVCRPPKRSSTGLLLPYCTAGQRSGHQYIIMVSGTCTFHLVLMYISAIPPSWAASKPCPRVVVQENNRERQFPQRRWDAIYKRVREQLPATCTATSHQLISHTGCIMHPQLSKLGRVAQRRWDAAFERVGVQHPATQPHPIIASLTHAV